MTRGQTNEMVWAVRHLLPEQEVLRNDATQKYLGSKIDGNYWLRYSLAMRGMDKQAEVVPLSRFSPGGLQKVWEDSVAPIYVKLAKEVYDLNRGKMKMLTTEAANEEDQRIHSSSAPATQSPPA